MSEEEREEFWNIFKSGEYECHTKMETFIENKFISKDKIRDMLNYLDNTSLNNYEIVMAFKKMMKELLEDGDHIPRID